MDSTTCLPYTYTFPHSPCLGSPGSTPCDQVEPGLSFVAAALPANAAFDPPDPASQTGPNRRVPQELTVATCYGLLLASYPRADIAAPWQAVLSGNPEALCDPVPRGLASVALGMCDRLLSRRYICMPGRPRGVCPRQPVVVELQNAFWPLGLCTWHEKILVRWHRSTLLVFIVQFVKLPRRLEEKRSTLP